MTDLAADEAIDRDLLVGELEATRFAETELREDTWNPLDWVYLLGDGLFTLIAREFAPLADRLASTAGRLEGMPAVLEAAEATLVGSRAGRSGASRPRRRSSSWPAIDELIADALTAAEAAAPTDPAIAAALPRLIAVCRRRRARRGRRLRAPPARRRAAGQPRARAAWAASCSRPRCATRCARRR